MLKDIEEQVVKQFPNSEELLLADMLNPQVLTDGSNGLQTTTDNFNIK